MSRFEPTGVERVFRSSEIGFPDFDISWAGRARPWREGFCFGSEDGRIKFAEIKFAEFDSPEGPDPIVVAKSNPIVVAESREAINGVAFSGDMMAVSTRGEVVFWHVSDSSTEGYESRTFAAGAHGVTVTPMGTFVAPLGIDGLLIKNPKSFDRLATTRIMPRGRTTYIYKLVSVRSTSNPDGELLVCAARRDGVAIVFTELNSPRGYLNTLRSPGNDIVDVCNIGAIEAPSAVAAIGKDCSLHLIRDAYFPGKPPTLRFNGLIGAAYRIPIAHGHIFLLTSRMLYAFPGLASRFLKSERPDGYTTAWALPFEAVDANIAGDRLLVVMPDHVTSMLIRDLVPEESWLAPSNGASRLPTTFETLPWEVCPSTPLEYAMT